MRNVSQVARISSTTADRRARRRRGGGRSGEGGPSGRGLGGGGPVGQRVPNCIVFCRRGALATRLAGLDSECGSELSLIFGPGARTKQPRRTGRGVRPES